MLETDGLLLLAEAYLELRDEDRALLALRRVRQVAESIGDAELLARVRLLLAERELQRAEAEARSRARGEPKDLGKLVFDPQTGTYRPDHR